MSENSQHCHENAVALPTLSTVKDYITLLKPGVMLLVVFSGVISMIVAPGNIHPLLIFVVTLALCAGSGGAAAINMALDHDIDAIMSRTKNRPVPSGVITPADALAFGVVISLIAIALMTVTVGFYPAIALTFAILFYTIVYTRFLKRATDQNIVIGGLAGAMPPLIGWLAVSTEFSLVPYALVLIIFLWTPPHFWALALYRADDYKRANVPMLPNTQGKHATKIQIFVYSLLLVPTSLAPFFLEFSSYFYAVPVATLSLVQVLASYKLLRQKDDNPTLARKIFGFSILWLFLVFTFLLVDRLPVITS